MLKKLWFGAIGHNVIIKQANKQSWKSLKYCSLSLNLLLNILIKSLKSITISVTIKDKPTIPVSASSCKYVLWGWDEQVFLS